MSISKENEILILVKDLKQSIVFYEKLFEVEITHVYKDRWAKIPDNLLFLINKQNDIAQNVQVTSHELEYIYGNNCVPVFLTDDIELEYKRISKISNNVSELCFLNLIAPYQFFTLKDPDGNMFEIGYYPEWEEPENSTVSKPKEPSE